MNSTHSPGADLAFSRHESEPRFSPRYIHARNQIVRPDEGLFVTSYFLRHWTPVLGALGTSIVLFLRNRVRGGNGAGSIVIPMRELALAVQTSERTLQREFSRNEALRRFVAVEEQHEQREKGRIYQTANLYHVAMDDPLVDEDGQRAARLLAAPSDGPDRDSCPLQQTGRHKKNIQRVAQPAPGKPTGFVPPPDRQNDGVGESRLPRQIGGVGHEGNPPSEASYSDILPRQESVTNQSGNVTVTRSTAPIHRPAETRSADAGTAPIAYVADCHALRQWRKTTEDLASLSSQELDDTASIAFHIRCWSHARRQDRRHGTQEFTGALFDLLRELTERKRKSGTASLGKAWTRRVKSIFEELGAPILLRANEDELAEVRAALANAPFMQQEVGQRGAS